MSIFKIKASTFQASQEFFNLPAVLIFLTKSFGITIADNEQIFTAEECHRSSQLTYYGSFFS